MSKNTIEPLLQEDVNRYVMFPIKDNDIFSVILFIFKHLRVFSRSKHYFSYIFTTFFKFEKYNYFYQTLEEINLLFCVRLLLLLFNSEKL